MELTPFEEMVRQALLDTAALEYRDALVSDAPCPAHSARYLAWEKKFLSDPFGYAKRHTRPLWQKALRTAACILLALSLAFGGLMLNPTARAWVQEIIAEWFGDYARFSFSGSAGQETGEWRTTWLPEGFSLVEEDKMNVMTDITYQDGHGTPIYFSYIPGNIGSFEIDTEHQEYESISINGMDAYLIRSTITGKMSYLVWVDSMSGTAFELASTLDTDSLHRIAEGVKQEGKNK